MQLERPQRARSLLTALAGLALLSSLLVGTTTASAADGSPGQFVIRCRLSHTLPDDPIVFPGQPGESHLHDFFGNTTVNADSTFESMLPGPTTCRVPSDTAGYWSPVVYVNGRQITPPVMRIYYLGLKNQDVETIPPGLKMIGGNRFATSAADNPNVRWYCGETVNVKTPRQPVPYDCTPWAQDHAFVDGIVAIVDMPNCWSGVGLEPSDVVYPVAGDCPPDFPHVLPRISQRIHLGVMSPTGPAGGMALTLASGPYFTMHSDFWNTWQQPRLDQLVAECLNADIRCGSVKPAPEPEWTHQFGTRRYDLATALDTLPGGVVAAGTTTYELPGQDYHRKTDAFVRTLDRRGNERWTVQFGTVGVDRIRAVVADGTAIYVAGSTDRALKGQRNRGGLDAFVRAYDLRGNELWTMQFGTAADDEAFAIALDDDAVYVAGTTGGRLGARKAGGLDGFVRKVSRSGHEVWTRQLGSRGTDRVGAIEVLDGRLYLAGTSDGAMGSEEPLGGFDGFVHTYSRAGEPLWTSQFGTGGSEDLRGLVVRPKKIYVAGTTDGAFPDTSPQGGLDGFVRRLDLTGAEAWTRQFGSAGDDRVTGLGSTSTGVLVAGATNGPLPDGVLLGETDAFLLKYDGKGAQGWTVQFGTDDFDAGLALTVGLTAAYVGGETHGAFEGHVNEGDRDAFVTKIRFA